MSGRLHRFFAGDHRRLDALFEAATVDPAKVDLQAFGRFRAGLLRHIAIEEKLLFPALRAARGETAALTAKLRVDHGALTALLVPTPMPAIVETILSILRPHNRREEEAAGVYALGDEAWEGGEVDGLLRQAEAYPEPPLRAYTDGPEVMKHVEAACELARRQWSEPGERDR